MGVQVRAAWTLRQTHQLLLKKHGAAGDVVTLGEQIHWRRICCDKLDHPQWSQCTLRTRIYYHYLDSSHMSGWTFLPILHLSLTYFFGDAVTLVWQEPGVL